MVLFVSDMHFGLATGASERAIERELITCLESFRPRVSHLYLVGDVFDGYIEYRKVVPKGFVRFMAYLAAWTDEGITVTYIPGNHDPWHRDYFAKELGVRVQFGPLEEQVAGVRCRIQHGDGLGKSGRGHRMLRALLTNRILVWIYRTFLPADLGLGLAQSVSRHVNGRPPDPQAAEDMRRFAHSSLQGSNAQAHIMGHSHQEEFGAWPEGLYLNLGSWRERQTMGALDAGMLQLLRWKGGRAEVLEAHAVPSGD